MLEMFAVVLWVLCGLTLTTFSATGAGCNHVLLAAAAAVAMVRVMQSWSNARRTR